jgi:hypothetical protein
MEHFTMYEIKKYNCMNGNACLQIVISMLLKKMP